MRHRWRDFSGGLWLVGPTEDNPPTALRRAKGVAPLRSVALRSRSGTLNFYTLDAHSMTRYNGFYFFGDGTNLTRSANANPLAPGSTTVVSAGVFDGTRLTFVQMPPTLDKADYLFVAGGGNLKKTDPAFGAVTEWGIAPPDYSNGAGADLSAALATQQSLVIDALEDIADAGSTWTETGDDIDTLQNDATRFTTGAASMRLEPLKDKSVEATRNFGAAGDAFNPTADFTTFGGGIDSHIEDFITFDVRINRPKHVKSIGIAFAVGTSAGGVLFDKSYSRDLKVQVVRRQRRKRLVGLGDIIKDADQAEFIADNIDQQRDHSRAEFLTEDTIGVARRRWTRVTIPKVVFESNGGAVEADWATVRGVRFTVETNKLGRANVNFDNLKLIGGTGMIGDYQYHVTFRNTSTGTRSNPDLTFGPITIEDVERQGVTLSNVPVSADTQVNQREIWRTIGNGAIFFLAGTIDDNTTTSFTDTTADYIGLAEGATDILQDEELPLDNIKPDDTFEDAVGPHLGRMWWTRDTATGTKGRVYFSPIARAEAVAGFVDVASEEDETQKLVIWNEQLWCFTKLKVYRILGFTEPFISTEVWGVPGTSQPHTVIRTPIGIVYRAKDGVRVFDGMSSTIIGPGDSMAPIWRNGTTDGIATFEGDVADYGRGEYYISDSTDVTKTTFAVNMTTGAWREVGFPSNFLFYDQKANVLFGRNVPATVGGMILIHESTHTGTFTPGTANPFIKPGGPGSIQASHTAARALVPRDITITRLALVVSAAPGVGQSVQVRFNVNGVTQSSPSITVTNATATNTAVLSAASALDVAEGDTLSIEFTFAGGAASLALRSLSWAYDIIPE